MNKAEKETLLRRTAPSRQKQAQEYLQGRSPGTMQRYAPDAHADPEQGWVEDEDTVRRLAKMCIRDRCRTMQCMTSTIWGRP